MDNRYDDYKREKRVKQEYFNIPEKCVTLEGDKPICALLEAFEICDWPSIHLLLPADYKFSAIFIVVLSLVLKIQLHSMYFLH